jgi:hypothetical protein
MFQFIYNVTQSIFTSIWFIIMTIMTGKMVKVSPYSFDNQTEGNSFFNICSDRFKKTNYPSNVSDKCKELIISDFIHHLSGDSKFTAPTSSVEYPIFDGKEFIGTQSWHSVMKNSLSDYVRKTK